MNRNGIEKSELLEIAQLCFSGGNRVCGDPSNLEAPLHSWISMCNYLQFEEDFTVKKIYLLAATMLLSAIWVVAQSSTQNSQTSPTGSADQSSIQGCLSGSSGNFMVTDSSGNAYKLQGDTSKLSDHVGQEVKISGKDLSSTASSGLPAGDKAPASAAQGGHSFDVSDIQKVSDTCTSSKR